MAFKRDSKPPPIRGNIAFRRDIRASVFRQFLSRIAIRRGDVALALSIPLTRLSTKQYKAARFGHPEIRQLATVTCEFVSQEVLCKSVSGARKLSQTSYGNSAIVLS